MTWAAPLYRRARWLLVVSLFALGLLFGVRAQADTIVRGFSGTGNLQPGWVVALDKTKSNAVVASPASDPNRIYGVVVDPSQAPVTLQPMAGNQVFVATNGTYPVLVNTTNGVINIGDYVSISTTNGIAAKATRDQSYVLGQALEKFDGTSNVITSSNPVVGRIVVTIQPGRNPLNKDNVAIPSPLRRAGEAIAGKNVSALRIYAALLVFVATAFVAAVIIWSGVRNGMISIGRNPLSRHSIFQGLVQVVAIGVLVFVIGVFAVYLLLKL